MHEIKIYCLTHHMECMEENKLKHAIGEKVNDVQYAPQWQIVFSNLKVCCEMCKISNSVCYSSSLNCF